MTAKVVENKTKVPPRVRCSCVLWFRLCNILSRSSFDLCHRIRVIVLLFSANYCSNANFGHLALVNCNAKLRSVFCCGFLFIAIMMIIILVICQGKIWLKITTFMCFIFVSLRLLEEFKDCKGSSFL